MSTLIQYFMIEALIGFGAAAVLFFVAYSLKNLWSGWKGQNESREKLRVSIDSILEVERQYTEAQTRMMAGLIEVSKSQVAQLDRLIQVVDVFRKSLLHQESGDNFQEYDETAAGREGDVQEYLRSGLDRGEAEARARNGDVWRKMSITR